MIHYKIPLRHGLKQAQQQNSQYKHICIECIYEIIQPRLLQTGQGDVLSDVLMSCYCACNRPQRGAASEAGGQSRLCGHVERPRHRGGH